MKFIRDPLYGFISLEKAFTEIVDSKEFQRLRRIKQLGFTYLVYPTAIHTRFEHSLGCFFLAEQLCKKFFCGEEFKAAALLHDIGHLPFSHAAEIKKHENITVEKIKSSEVRDILERHGLSTRKICNLILGKGKFGRLISGDIDVDRLDYLRRDAYYTGVAYGVTDPDVVIKSLAWERGGLSVRTEYVPALESILIARYMMYPTVYNHHTVRIAKAMFRKALQNLLNKKLLSISDLANMDETDIISIMRNSDERKIMERIDNRKLYKTVFTLRKNDINNMRRLFAVKNRPKKRLRLENELSETFGCDILIDIPEKPVFEESRIVVSETKKPLSSFSPLVNALAKAEWNFWYVGIYASRPRKSKIKKLKSIVKDLF